MSDSAGRLTPDQPNEPHMDALIEAFLDRYRRGERPSISEYLEKYPHLAERVRELYPVFMFLERLGAGAEEAAADGIAHFPDASSGTGNLRQLGEYRIAREIGRGGMGVVYEAWQESLGRQVALKVLPLHSLTDERFLKRFRLEAHAAAKLQHPNIVPIFGIGEEGGIHYFAMQYIRGENVARLVREVARLTDGNLPPSEESSGSGSLSTTIALGLMTGRYDPSLQEAQAQAPDDPSRSAQVDSRSRHEEAATTDSSRGSAQLSPLARPEHLGASHAHESRAVYLQNVARIGQQVAGALSYAHGQGILHRDIKPSNLLIDGRGWPWITDFGLAKVEGIGDLTQSGEVVGTLAYLPPERFRGASDARSDVYGLGLTLYELLTLHRPFAEMDRAVLMQKVVAEMPPRSRDLDARIPPALDAIVMRAIEKDPGRRQQTAAEFERELAMFLAGEPVVGPRKAIVVRGSFAPRTRRAAVAAAILIVVLLAGFYGFLGGRSRPEFSEPFALLVGPGRHCPSGVAAADLDANGFMDLITVNAGSGDISVLMSRGARSFAEAVRFPTGAMPRTVAAVDIDGDHVVDLVVGNQHSQDLVVLRGDGRGSFTEKQKVLFAEQIFAVASADLDGDGAPDLTVSGKKNHVWVLRNEGGKFAEPPAPYAVGEIPAYLVIEDIDGDGRRDIVTVNLWDRERHISLLYNRGDGTFEEPEHHAVCDRFACGVIAADFDGDGTMDLAGSGGQPNNTTGGFDIGTTMWLLRNEGGRAFAEATSVEIGAPFQSLIAADLDGDGHKDVAAVGGMNTLIVLRNDGKANFEKVVKTLPGIGPSALVATDLDGDGRIDLAVSTFQSNEVVVLPNRGGVFSGR
jgi:serine/threonine protein kinase